MLDNEVWKDIPSYEGLYQVSNYGRVKSYPRLRRNWTGGEWVQPAQLMAMRLNEDGYSVLSLTMKNGKRKAEKVHRLVALAFIPNPKGYPEVNHLNGIRNDNRVENLEWTTHKENNQYKHKLKTSGAKYILCIETNEIFYGSSEAAAANGGDAVNIRKSARSNGYYGVKGFHYRYIEG